MNKRPIIFRDTTMEFDDGEEFVVMYLYKDFVFVQTNERSVSFCPLTKERVNRLLESAKGKCEEIDDVKTILYLETNLMGRTAEEELKELKDQECK